MSSPCREVNILARMVAKDVRTATSRNLRLIEAESGGHTWEATPWKIREGCAGEEPDVPRVDSWRLPYLGKLLEERDDLVYKGVETEQVENLQELIDSLCIN